MAPHALRPISLAAMLVLATVAPAAGAPENAESPNADTELGRLFPDLIGEQVLDSWTLTGPAYLELFDPSIEADLAARDEIVAALEERGLVPDALGVGNGVYLPPQGGFANLTAVRLTEGADLLEVALLVWERTLLADEALDVVLDTGDTVSVHRVGGSPRQEPFSAVVFAEDQVAWLIEAPEEELGAVISAIRSSAAEVETSESSADPTPGRDGSEAPESS